MPAGPAGSEQDCTDCSYELEVRSAQTRTQKLALPGLTREYTLARPISDEDYTFRLTCISASCGRSPQSQETTEGVCPAPAQPVCPRDISAEARGRCEADDPSCQTKITVEWEHAQGCLDTAFGHQMCHYELSYSWYLTEDTSRTVRPDATITVYTNDLTFDLYDPDDAYTYLFRLVACNECGKSSASRELVVVPLPSCDKPEPPICLYQQITDCQVRIDWFMGDDGGCEIQEYQIMIQSARREWEHYSDDGCGQNPGQSRTCMVSMQRLRESPFFLRTKD